MALKVNAGVEELMVQSTIALHGFMVESFQDVWEVVKEWRKSMRTGAGSSAGYKRNEEGTEQAQGSKADRANDDNGEKKKDQNVPVVGG